MDKEFIVVPNTNQTIYDGSVVILNRLPGTKWILHHGYYTYNGQRANGWYFSSIPSGTTMPLFQSDLFMLRVVDDTPCPPGPGPCPPGPGPGPCPPGPCPPCPPSPEVFPFTKWDKDQTLKAMITVDTLADRDALSSANLQPGKVVRVNDYQGHVEYFQWNSTDQKWDLLDWGPRVALAADVEDTYVTKDDFEDLSDQVDDNTSSLEWKSLPDDTLTAEEDE